MKRKKQYPGGGPSIEAQRLMEFPRRNRQRLLTLINGNAMRKETRDVLNLDRVVHHNEVKEKLATLLPM